MTQGRIRLSDAGFQGTHFGVAGNKGIIMLVVSGSDGGMKTAEGTARFYQANGIPALAVALFGTGQTQPYLSEVPLEYIEAAIHWAKGSGYGRIGIDALSKGTEYALLAASLFHDISTVIARVPSYFVSEGMLGKKGPSGTSCWTYRKKPFPFAPYAQRKFNVPGQFIKYKEFNILEYNTGKAIAEENLIPLDKMQASILLLSASNDTVWPSRESAGYIERSLRECDYQYPYKHISYDHLSHFLLPYESCVTRLLFRSERSCRQERRTEREAMNRSVLTWIRNNNP